MKETIKLADYAQTIIEMIPKGVLLNTCNEKFNSMVIGWGGLGTIWGVPQFTVYVREHRYTKAQLDATGEFSISVPLDGPVQRIAKICGSMSGNNIDKVKEAGLTLEEPRVIKTPGVKEYPLTLECRILYAQRQELSLIPEEIRRAAYPQDVDSSNPLANRDLHTSYIAQIVDAYIIR